MAFVGRHFDEVAAFILQSPHGAGHCMENDMTTKFNTENRWLRTKEAAAYVGLSKSTLEKLRVTGDGPEYAALGRVIVYQIQDLDEWISAHKRRSTSDSPPKAA